MSNIISDLYSIGCIKTGKFILKSGEESNVYIDLRKVMSSPKLLYKISEELSKLIDDSSIMNNSDVVICGVPTGALSYATMISNILNLPMIMVRKNKKKYGLQNQIEGSSNNTTKCILIEDVVTTGSSCLEIIKILESNNIEVIQVLSIIDRRLKDNPININNNTILSNFSNSFNQKFELLNYNYSSLFNIQDILDYSPENNIRTFTDYENNLLNLIDNKKSNIILSADLENPSEILRVIEETGEHIVGVKLHLDTIKFDHSINIESDTIKFDHLNTESNLCNKCVENSNITKEDFYDRLVSLKEEYNLFLIEDRKLSDIGHIMNKQANLVPSFIDMITTHSVTGYKSVASIERPILLLHCLSTDSLCDNNYKNRTLDMAYNLPNLVGLVSQDNLSDFLVFTPGINLDVKGDTQGQRYKGPMHSDFYIIGRGIYRSDDPTKSAIRYKKACYDVYKKTNINKFGLL